jgi:60 kDa SS-A/Ro ribonucleoprotein
MLFNRKVIKQEKITSQEKNTVFSDWINSKEDKFRSILGKKADAAASLTSVEATTNYAGEKAYSISPALELYSAVATSTFSDKFYEKNDVRIERLRTLITQNDPEFVAKLAIYAREKMYLRSLPLVLTVELSKQTSGSNLISRLTGRAVQRADEITEILAYYAVANARTNTPNPLSKLSKQLQKGLAISFNKFDEYQFAKYNRDGAVKLKDALFLVHPKAKDEAQQSIFNKLANDELATPYTWETELSALGQQTFESEDAKNAAVSQKWEELITSQKLGYMALMRNLRNILEANVSPAHIEMVCNTLSDASKVTKSKQLPFRYLSAFRELKGLQNPFTNVVLQALETAIVASISNLRGFDYNTNIVIACDVSGSMQQAISAKSKVMLYDIGLLLGMLLQSKCKNVTAGMFGDTWKTIAMPTQNVLANVNEFYRREGEVGYSTNGYLVIKDLIERKQKADKIMLFSDAQLWNSNVDGQSFEKLWLAYQSTIAPNAKLYIFDLAGHGQMPLRIEQNGVHLIAGWSDKVFDVLEALENGQNALSEIEKIEF